MFKLLRQLGTGNVENAEHRKTLGVCTRTTNSYNVEFSCVIQSKISKLFSVYVFNAKCIISDYTLTKNGKVENDVCSAQN